MPYKNYEEALRKNREYKQRRIREAKEQGLCTKCFKPLEDSRLGKSTCENCAAKRRASNTTSWIFYQSIGICPRCTKNKIIGDEKSCLECRAMMAEKKAKKMKDANIRQHSNEVHNAWQRRHIAELREQGMCTKCGKRQADKGYKRCGICRAKQRDYCREKRLQKDSIKQIRLNNGLCIWCDTPQKEGYKICEQHYQGLLEKRAKVDNTKLIRFQLNNRKVGG